MFNDKINLTTQINGMFFIELEKYSDEEDNSSNVKHSLLEFAPEKSIKSISSFNLQSIIQFKVITFKGNLHQ